MEPCKIWIEQCEAARRIEDDFGTDKALDYLIREKFLNFLEAAETDASFAPRSPTSLTRSRRSSSDGNSLSAWRRHGKPSPSIPTCTPTKTMLTWWRRSDRTTLAAPLPTSCSVSEPESGCWRSEETLVPVYINGSFLVNDRRKESNTTK